MTRRVHGLDLDVAGFSEQGPRAENQDAFSVDALATDGFVAVADGMGGERSGRLAADTALQALLDAAPIASVEAARRAVRAADQAVAGVAAGAPSEHEGMGCAIALLALAGAPGEGPLWIGAHVGDVRIVSRSPDGAVRLETRDHTPAFQRWEAGEVGLDEVPDTPGANRLQRAVGRGGSADAVWLPARPGWAWAIISDGVTKAMRLDELGEALSAPAAEEACERIRRKVLERGPDDNFTAVVVRAAGSSTASTPVPAEPRRDAVMPPRRSPLVVALGMLTILALLAAGLALWETRRGTQEREAQARQLEQLRLDLDSIRAVVDGIEDPFGPAAPGEPTPVLP
jgi:serine/threonine protein phosphatase PrpC